MSITASGSLSGAMKRRIGDAADASSAPPDLERSYHHGALAAERQRFAGLARTSARLRAWQPQ